MNFKAWLGKYSFENQDLYYKLVLVFGLFFILPVFGFIAFALKYEILNDRYFPPFVLLLLIFFFIGFRLLRKLFDHIRAISTAMTRRVKEETTGEPVTASLDELGNIVQSFRILEGELKSQFVHLERKTTELATLKELSDLCHLTFNPDDLLYITLERALKLVNADVGSIMMLTGPNRNAFTIEASISLDDMGKKGAITSFDDSIAKYAVISKSPLLVEDIETDSRFGRKSRARYASKSFICVPMKTSNDVIGVMNVSRRQSEAIFSQADVDALTPLLSNVAFTYDNLRLLSETQELRENMKSLGLISKALTSSLKGSELLQAVFHEMRKTIPFDMIAVLTEDPGIPGNLTVVDFLAFIPPNLNRGDSLPYAGSILDKAIKQRRSTFIGNVAEFASPIEVKLFHQKGVQSCLVMPLSTEGRITGLLLIFNVIVEECERMADIIDVIADHLSQALEKDRMVSSVIKREQELESLRLIGSALSSSTFDIDKMLMYTMDMIRVSMHVEAGYILLRYEDALTFAAAFHLDMERLKEIRLKMGEGIAGYVFDRGMTVIANDAQGHPHFSPVVDQATGFYTRSILSVPMISQSRVIGVIEIMNKTQETFNSGDEQLLQSIATSVSIALENARLYGETVALAEKERGIRHVFQKFVPREVVDKIIQEADKERSLLGEFRTITLLNIDLRGFTPLSRKIGPLRTVDMLNYFFSTMGEIVFKYHGIVDKYLGDGFLALFGAPVSSASDAENAVTAALEMQKAMEEVSAYGQRLFNEEISMGLSVHTGEVVVGNIGFEKKMDYTVIGDAVNIVFKLQALCRNWPNDILISETTLDEVKSRLEEMQVEIYEIGQTNGNLKIFRIRASSGS
ncbi:MAG: GAF domain-containing protein [Syntrophales bacterium]|nr:GAF domain-containing protein [Syntrophales bacterium]